MGTMAARQFRLSVLVVSVVLLAGGGLARAAQSVNVAIVGSPAVTNGGYLPTTGADFSAFMFSNLTPANVTAANLAAFDTVALNVASSEMGCDTATLSDSAKADLVSFVRNGHKLIIYDSECEGVTDGLDYSWLPFPFTTANPGAAGATGTLTIAEENVLSSDNPSDPHFIDAGALGAQTDAVGDANVMTTRDFNWCLDMSATNVNNISGPAHTYARLGSGLLIYNGLDVDEMSSTGPASWLEKIWLFELQARFNPVPIADLPCNIRVAAGAQQAAPALAPAGLGLLAAMLGLFGTLRLRNRRANHR